MSSAKNPLQPDYWARTTSGSSRARSAIEAWDKIAEAISPFSTDSQRLERALALLTSDDERGELARKSDGIAVPQEVPDDLAEARRIDDLYQDGVYLLRRALQTFQSIGSIALADGTNPIDMPKVTDPFLDRHEGRVAVLAEAIIRDRPALNTLKDLAGFLTEIYPEFATKAGRKYDSDGFGWNKLKHSLKQVIHPDGKPILVTTVGRMPENGKAAADAIANRSIEWLIFAINPQFIQPSGG
ncbi:MAG: hypothetical protein IH855_04445 [Bacteroidetes bacterium]|nr:hypothetical protein [Bacteroidota bacterium]